MPSEKEYAHGLENSSAECSLSMGKKLYQQCLVVKSPGGGGGLVVERAMVDHGGPTRSPSRLARPGAGVLLKTGPGCQPSSGITAQGGGKKAQVCPLTWLGTPLNGPACCRAPVGLAKASPSLQCSPASHLAQPCFLPLPFLPQRSTGDP